MATMAEHEASMTMFYYKSNGEIYSYCTGIADMSMFGIHQADYELILDFIVIPRDHVVMDFMYKFYVDVETKELKLKTEYQSLTRYL